MLVRISNVPRDYAWGSHDAIARLEGREPSGRPEAEVWFGDHAGNPARVEDGTGRTLDQWIAQSGPSYGVHEALPYLLKVLAAASPLSIQAHPSLVQARAGFAQEEAAGIPRDAPNRNYRDANHKPEVIVALSDTFEALVGFRPIEQTRRLLDVLSAGESDSVATAAIDALRSQLAGTRPHDALRDTVAWLLSGEGARIAPLIIAAVRGAAARIAGETDADRADRADRTDGADGATQFVLSDRGEFAADLTAAARIADFFPGDPGVVVALLLNRMVLTRGEALFVPAGLPHAYLDGLGVEVMAASDNVMRGGLTPKHIDVAELLHVLDTTPGERPLLLPSEKGAGIERFAPPVADFSLLRVRADAAASAVALPLAGAAIALVTEGEIILHGRDSADGETIVLRAGQACFVTPDEPLLHVSGRGELFVAEPGAPLSSLENTPDTP